MNFSNPVASIPYVGRYTWATLPSASAAGAGATAQCSDIGPTTAHLVSTGTYWRVLAPTDIVFDTTSANGDTTGNDQVIKTSGTLPAGLLRLGRSMSIKVLYGKSGTTDAVTFYKLRIGTAGTTADAVVSSAAVAATMRYLASEQIYFLSSATQLRVLSAQNQTSAWPGSSGATAYPQNYTISDADANALIISAGLDLAGTTDTPQVHHMIVTMYP